jgi:hypothetical protein
VPGVQRETSKSASLGRRKSESELVWETRSGYAWGLEAEERDVHPPFSCDPSSRTALLCFVGA